MTQVITARHVSKCTEFGTIKIGIVEHFPFSKVLYDRMVANNLEPHYLTHPGEVIKEDKHKAVFRDRQDVHQVQR